MWVAVVVVDDSLLPHVLPNLDRAQLDVLISQEVKMKQVCILEKLNDFIKAVLVEIGNVKVLFEIEVVSYLRGDQPAGVFSMPINGVFERHPHTGRIVLCDHENIHEKG
jgi:hypothetical protein